MLSMAFVTASNIEVNSKRILTHTSYSHIICSLSGRIWTRQRNENGASTKKKKMKKKGVERKERLYNERNKKKKILKKDTSCLSR